VLAASAGNDFLQAGFSWVCARSDSREEPAASGPVAAPPRAA